MGVYMTASEANRQRVLALILAEDAPLLQRLWDALDAKSTAVRRGKPAMSEVRQPLVSLPSDISQLVLF